MKFALIPLTALFSMLILFIITRLTGSRQISSMSIYEYVNSITLGSLAAQLAVADNETFFTTLIAIVVYGAVTVFCALYTNKNRAFRRYLTGNPVVLMEHGKLFRENFTKARMDIEELCAHLRAQGYFDLSKLDSVVMETTGRISVLPRAAERPMTPRDAKIPVNAERICRNFIVDGQILDENLRAAGYDRAWLEKQLAENGYKHAHEVFLCCEGSDGSGSAVFFAKDVKGGKSL